MINQDQLLPSLIDTPGVDPEEKGVKYWYEAYLKLKQEKEELETRLSAAEKELEELQILDFRFWIGDELVRSRV
jgi:hypothetical protein